MSTETQRFADRLADLLEKIASSYPTKRDDYNTAGVESAVFAIAMYVSNYVARELLLKLASAVREAALQAERDGRGGP